MPRFKTSKKKTATGGSNRGRKRLPTELHALNGNPSKIDLVERQQAEPKFIKVAPDCPDWLTGDARDEWNRLAPQLETLGLLTSADLAAFAAYCQCYSDFKYATEQLQIVDWIQETESGYKQQHPLVGIRNSSLEKMKAFLVEFGFTPASRSKVSVKEPEKPEGISGLLSG